MRKVAFVAEYPASPDRVVGGVQAVVRQLAVEIVRRGLEVHAVSTEIGRTDAAEETLEGVRVHRLPATPRFGNLTLGRAERQTTAAMLRRIAPDVVHAHVLGPPALGAAESGLPWVATAHGMQEAEGRVAPGWVNRVRSSSRVRMERMSLARLRHLIVISPYVLGYFGERASALVVHRIENPVQDSFFRVNRRPEPGRILFTGRLIPRKDVATLLRALSKLAADHSTARLRVAGAADRDGHAEELRSLAGELGLAERVEFLGSLSPAEVEAELAAAAVWVQSSRQETASIALMEAMAAGVPVVATDVGGTRHLVDADRTGRLVPPADPEALAGSLEGWLRDPDAAERAGRAARAEAELRFRATAVVDRTLAVYERAKTDAGAPARLQSAGSGGRN